MKKVLVFGTFDGLHSGHIHFLKQAKKLGSELVVSIAADKVVKKLKNKFPHLSENERKELVGSLRMVDKVLVGDSKISSYNIVKRVKPDIICLGYDQKKLSKDIKKKLPNIKIFVIKSYKGKKIHSSIMRT